MNFKFQKQQWLKSTEKFDKGPQKKGKSGGTTKILVSKEVNGNIKKVIFISFFAHDLKY